MRKLLTLLFGLGLLLVTSGCVALVAGAAAGAGGYAYYKGELRTNEDYPIDAMWVATKKAASRLQLGVDESDKDSLTARLKATSADGKKINIHLKRLTDHATQLRIRVGVLGDERLSNEIRDTILEEVKKVATSSTKPSA